MKICLNDNYLKQIHFMITEIGVLLYESQKLEFLLSKDRYIDGSENFLMLKYILDQHQSYFHSFFTFEQKYYLFFTIFFRCYKIIPKIPRVTTGSYTKELPTITQNYPTKQLKQLIKKIIVLLSNKIIIYHFQMDQTSNGFKTNQQMGLFTFYKMQEQKQHSLQLNVSIANPEIKNNKLAPIPKLSVANQNKQLVVKRRVQSVFDYQQQIDENEPSKMLNHNIKVNKKKLSEAVSQQKHSIIDFSFDFSSSRRKNAAIQLFQSNSQRTKTTNPVQYQIKQWDLYKSNYFHSLNLMKMKQIKKEEIKELFKSSKQQTQQYAKFKMRHRTEVQKSIVDSMQEKQIQFYNQSVKLKQSSPSNKIKNQKQEPLNFLQYLQQKKKKMTQEYKKVRLNKKIGDILNLKLNENYPFKLKRVAFDRSELAYMIPSSRYPIYK